MVETDFGLAGGEKTVQGRQVGGLVRLPWESLVLGEGGEVWGAGGGCHASIEARAWGAHSHPHGPRLKADAWVEAVADRSAHGAHHGAGGGEGRDGGALDGGWSGRVGQGHGVQRRHVVEKTAGQIFSLPQGTEEMDG